MQFYVFIIKAYSIDTGINFNYVENNYEILLQTRQFRFSLSNPGIVDLMFAWKINMDEQYPRRHLGDGSNVISRPRTAEETRSQNSRSPRGIFSAKRELSRRDFEQDEYSAGDSTNFLSQQCTSFVSSNFIECLSFHGIIGKGVILRAKK